MRRIDSKIIYIALFVLSILLILTYNYYRNFGQIDFSTRKYYLSINIIPFKNFYTVMVYNPKRNGIKVVFAAVDCFLMAVSLEKLIKNKPQKRTVYIGCGIAIIVTVEFLHIVTTPYGVTLDINNWILFIVGYFLAYLANSFISKRYPINIQ